MADRLPNMIVLVDSRRPSPPRYVTPVLDEQQRLGNIRVIADSVFTPLAKIEVEPAETDARFVHLRFSHTNKYWARSADDQFLTATTQQPVEDPSNPQCTLFEFIYRNPNSDQVLLRHVHTTFFVNFDLNAAILFARSTDTIYAFNVLDLESFVRLPRHVAFKGYNDRYLRGIWFQNLPYLQLSSNDPNEEECSYEVQTMNDGRVRIKSLHFDRYWRLSPNWIWADRNVVNDTNINTMFWPVKIDDNIIALRNLGNNRFVKSLSADRKDNCLNAALGNITIEARLEVEELVLKRDIYNVRYRMEDARIYDERPFLAGVATATNLTEEESSLTVTVAFEDSYSYTFTNSLSITKGVSTKIRAGIPKIASGKLEVSTEINNTFEWERTTTETKSVTAEHTVSVPAKSRARVGYVGTQGKCSVPFNYNTRDKRSVNGEIIISTHIDGIYSGVNYYNFQFEALETEAL